MKQTTRILLAFYLACLALVSQVGAAYAVPPLPSGFWGAARFNGQDAPPGAQVTAWINGLPYAVTTTQLYQGQTVYSLDIPGDDPATTAIEGGVPGDLVQFTIDAFPTQESGVWQSGSNLQLDLSVAGVALTYLPLLLR